MNTFCRACINIVMLLALTTHAIDVRQANRDEISRALALDEKITWEFFKPLFLEYTNQPFGEDVDSILEEDLQIDVEMFTKGVENQDGYRLYIALDDKTIVGFIAFQEDHANITIHLLCIDRDYRGKGIGRKLLDAARNVFADAVSCSLLVLDKNVSACKMYESYGFIRKEVPDEIKGQLKADIYFYYTFALK